MLNCTDLACVLHHHHFYAHLHHLKNHLQDDNDNAALGDGNNVSGSYINKFDNSEHDSDLSSLSHVDAPSDTIYMVCGVMIAMLLVGLIIILVAVTISKLRKREDSNAVTAITVETTEYGLQSNNLSRTNGSSACSTSSFVSSTTSTSPNSITSKCDHNEKEQQQQQSQQQPQQQKETLQSQSHQTFTNSISTSTITLNSTTSAATTTTTTTVLPALTPTITIVNSNGHQINESYNNNSYYNNSHNNNNNNNNNRNNSNNNYHYEHDQCDHNYHHHHSHSHKNENDESITFTRTSGGDWIFPPKAPTPNIYNFLNQDLLNAAASHERNGFKGLRKQFSGRFKRLVSKKTESSNNSPIPPELKPQLKTIYVY